MSNGKQPAEAAVAGTVGTVRSTGVEVPGVSVVLGDFGILGALVGEKVGTFGRAGIDTAEEEGTDIRRLAEEGSLEGPNHHSWVAGFEGPNLEALEHTEAVEGTVRTSAAEAPAPVSAGTKGGIGRKT